MSRAMKLIVVTVVAVTMLLGLSAPAGADHSTAEPPGTDISAQFWGPDDECPPGSSVTVVIDGETVDPADVTINDMSFPGVPPFPGLFYIDVFVTNVNPGAQVLSVLCNGGTNPVAGTAIAPFTSNCDLDDFDLITAGYTPDPFCIKIFHVSAQVQFGLQTFTGWSWADGGSTLDQGAASVVADGSTVAQTSLIERASVISVGSGSAPWLAVQLVAAAAGVGALALFVGRRRQRNLVA